VETVVAMLMVLGIFVGIPAVIGFAIAGVYVAAARRTDRAQRARLLGETAEAVNEKPLEVRQN